MSLIIDFAKPHRPKETLLRSEARQDLMLLGIAMRNAYPAKWVMPKPEWDEVLQKLEHLPLAEEISAEEFGHRLADILSVIPDGHISVQLYKRHLGTHNRRHLTPTTGKNIAGEKVWDIQDHDSPLGKIPVVGISWFPPSEDAVWNGFIEKFERLLVRPAIIFDLRANDGGDDTTAVNFTSLLLGYNLPENWINEIICETPESYALQLNTYNRILSGYRARKQGVPQELIEATKRLQDAVGSPLPGKSVRRAAASAHAGQPRYKGKILVLIDKQTKSSGEWAALYLQQHPHTRLVGENTYGMIHFGNTGLLRLPVSGLHVTLCMKINELSDGRFFEKTGIPPDTILANQDSLNFTLAALGTPRTTGT